MRPPPTHTPSVDPATLNPCNRAGACAANTICAVSNATTAAGGYTCTCKPGFNSTDPRTVACSGMTGLDIAVTETTNACMFFSHKHRLTLSCIPNPMIYNVATTNNAVCSPGFGGPACTICPPNTYMVGWRLSCQRDASMQPLPRQHRPQPDWCHF